jgi:hypothetical protein
MRFKRLSWAIGLTAVAVVCTGFFMAVYVALVVVGLNRLERRIVGRFFPHW